MQSNFLRHRGARALALALIAAVGFAGATPALAYWHHDRGWHHHDRWHGGVWGDPGYYAAPPVVYGPAPVYAPPPVVYSPGINLGIHLGR
jgi:hypothetical protein